MKIAISGILIFLFFGCDTTTRKETNLSLIPHDKLLTRIANNEVDLPSIVYKNKSGQPLTKKDRKLLNSGRSKREFYENNRGEITEIRISEASQNDWIKEIQINESFSNPFQNIKLFKVDCTMQDSIISICFKRDQEVRKNQSTNISEIDKLNQQDLIPYLEQCEWPTEPELIKGIWYIIQHSSSSLMALYYSRFKAYESKGFLKSSTMALMEDRMLMHHGFPQIYGSQIIHQSVYEMIDPANVNERRASVGLGTIEENTRRFGFEFKMEDYLINN